MIYISSRVDERVWVQLCSLSAAVPGLRYITPGVYDLCHGHVILHQRYVSPAHSSAHIGKV